MHKTFDFKKYVEYKVYSVTTIKKGYGFRVLLTFCRRKYKDAATCGIHDQKRSPCIS